MYRVQFGACCDGWSRYFFSDIISEFPNCNFTNNQLGKFRSEVYSRYKCGTNEKKYQCVFGNSAQTRILCRNMDPLYFWEEVQGMIQLIHKVLGAKIITVVCDGCGHMWTLMGSRCPDCPYRTGEIDLASSFNKLMEETFGVH